MTDQFLGFSPTAWQAIFAGVVAVLTIVQLCIYFQQLAMTKSVERAWISLQNLVIEAPANMGGDLTIAATFKNSGRSTARIVAANITLRSAYDENGTIRYLTDLPESPTYDAVPSVVPPAVLVADESSTLRVSAKEFSTLNRWQLGSTDSQWIYGYVHYVDSLTPNRIRRYGWARQFDRELSARAPSGWQARFRHVNKPEYNYAD